MARPLRIEFEGALYHVMSRGNERRRIVRDDADRTRRLEWLRRTVETYGWHLHAFVLMDNHDHLYVDPSLAELESLRPRPSLEHIVTTVARSFGTDSLRWLAGTRTNYASRAVAAFLARRKYGYRAAEVAKVLGYTSHGGVAMGVKRIESAGPALRRQVQQLKKSLTND